MAELSTDIRETVRERYAAAARAAAAGDFTSAREVEYEPACCSPDSPTFSPDDAANAAAIEHQFLIAHPDFVTVMQIGCAHFGAID